jgi:uncharacterized membrane protein
MLAMVAVLALAVWIFSNDKLAVRYYFSRSLFRPKWTFWPWSIYSYILFNRILSILVLGVSASALLMLLFVPPRWVFYVLLCIAALIPVFVLVKSLKAQNQDKVDYDNLVEEELTKMARKFLDQKRPLRKTLFL